MLLKETLIRVCPGALYLDARNGPKISDILDALTSLQISFFLDVNMPTIIYWR